MILRVCLVSLALAGCLDPSKYGREPPAPVDERDAAVVDAGRDAGSATVTDADSATVTDTDAVGDATSGEPEVESPPEGDGSVTDSASAPCEVHFLVTLPADTPADDPIHLAGDLGATPWVPDVAALALVRDGARAELTLELDAGTMRYKYTRGSWETVEETAACGDRANRTAVVRCPGGRPFEVRDTVEAWADLCE